MAGTLVQGQDFAPIGAEWYYHEGFAFSGDVDYIKFTSTQDTLIHGETCRKITKRHKLGCNNRPMVEYIFTRNDTVFFFDSDFNDFQILYDFSAERNTSWIVKMKDENEEIDTVEIFVDSISSTIINGQNLKILYVTYDKRDEYMPYTYASKIIERIGDITYMFNWTNFSQIACDINWTRGLNCYYDVDFGLYSTGLADSCDYTFEWTSTAFKSDNPALTAFPNPTAGPVEITYFSAIPLLIQVKDLVGVTVLERTIAGSGLIDLSNLPDGLYLVMGIAENEFIHTIQVVKY